MTNEEQREENLAQEIQNIYFEAGARVDIHTWNKTKSILAQAKAQEQQRINKYNKLVKKTYDELRRLAKNSPLGHGNSLRQLADIIKEELTLLQESDKHRYYCETCEGKFFAINATTCPCKDEYGDTCGSEDIFIDEPIIKAPNTTDKQTNV